MMMNTTTRAGTAGVLALLMAATAGAATERIETTAKRTLTTDDGRFGGCMVQLDERLRTRGWTAREPG